MAKERIFIGIPCYSAVAPEILEDYMRFAFHLGRRYQEYDFFLGIKTKSEQFRARNAIVESALGVGCDWLLMLDDDHILDIDYETGNLTDGVESYNFLRKLLAHNVDIVGPVYYQRGGSARPVVMDEDESGKPYFISDIDLGNGLEERAVQGGGCILINMRIFDKVKSPWFEPEFDLGTDIQICKKARDAGYGVYNDSSMEIGHVLNERSIITSRNKDQFKVNPIVSTHSQTEMAWQTDSLLHKYKYDAGEYLGISENDIDYELRKLWDNYAMKTMQMEEVHGLGSEDYYKHIGPEQLARQVLYHHNDNAKTTMAGLLQEIKPQKLVGIDFGCGSAPVGFELARRGGTMHFIDIEGSTAYEFLKWRCKKYKFDNAFFDWPEPKSADYCLCLDSIEHMSNWKDVLDKIISHLKVGGNLVTNFMRLNDNENPEHVFMDKPSFMQFIVGRDLMVKSDCVFIKRA